MMYLFQFRDINIQESIVLSFLKLLIMDNSLKSVKYVFVHAVRYSMSYI